MDKVTQQNAANAEELSGQAANLRMVVSGLLTIVEGSNAHHQYTSMSSAADTVTRGIPIDKHRKDKRRKTVSGRNHRSVMVSSGNEVRPEQVIPLDDQSDLAEF